MYLVARSGGNAVLVVLGAAAGVAGAVGAVQRVHAAVGDGPSWQLALAQE